MDNFRFDITSDKNLDAVLTVAFSEHKKATHWKKEEKRLILAWHQPSQEGFYPFISPVDAETVKPFILAWLQEQPQPKNWGDVWVRKAFRVYNEGWGHIDGNHYAFVAIEPAEAWIGK